MKDSILLLSFILFYSICFLWMPGCSSTSNSVENVPRQVLLSSSEALMIEGRTITLSSTLTRDYVPNSAEDESPLTARIEIVASKGEVLPEGLNTDAVWVMVDDQVWGSSYSGEQLKDDKTRIVKIANEGPNFGIGKKAVVIVRIRNNGSTYLLRANNQEIERAN
ncbi:MAG: hypothetical protein RI575_09300 [Balneolaceae bacterium]|nr:hypothetical protein [Balneolaceae bacterium]MDR9407676.1 hypothetical protein [Balneolaceae bacterium]